MRNIYYFTFSVGQGFESSLAECLWSKVSHKFIVKLSTGAAVIKIGLGLKNLLPN